MHPEMISDQPGKCVKCGMNLVKKEQETKDGETGSVRLPREYARNDGDWEARGGGVRLPRFASAKGGLTDCRLGADFAYFVLLI